MNSERCVQMDCDDPCNTCRSSSWTSSILEVGEYDMAVKPVRLQNGRRLSLTSQRFEFYDISIISGYLPSSVVAVHEFRLAYGMCLGSVDMKIQLCSDVVDSVLFVAMM